MGWKTHAIDPCHWHWERGGAEGYFGVREREMVNAIRVVVRDEGPLIINCGLLHLAALRDVFGGEMLYVAATAPMRIGSRESLEFQRRMRFVAMLPTLVR